MSEPVKIKPCKCLEIVKAKLIESHGPDSDVNFELKMQIDMGTLDLKPALPPLYYSYKEGKKRKKSYVMFSFCPFCGKPYDP